MSAAPAFGLGLLALGLLSPRSGEGFKFHLALVGIGAAAVISFAAAPPSFAAVLQAAIILIALWLAAAPHLRSPASLAAISAGFLAAAVIPRIGFSLPETMVPETSAAVAFALAAGSATFIGTALGGVAGGSMALISCALGGSLFPISTTAEAAIAFAPAGIGILERYRPKLAALLLVPCVFLFSLEVLT